VSALTKKLEEAYVEICESLKSPSFPLHKAAQEGKTVAVKALIYCGANKEERCEGNTPLYWVAQSGQTATVETLINLGADKEASNEYGFTSLHIATVYGNFGVAEALIHMGANIEAKIKQAIPPFILLLSTACGSTNSWGTQTK
jgi:ankyrin repeat protein